MTKKLYLECYSGISGDMMAAALLDLGADAERLRRTLATLKVDGYTVKISRVKKSGLDVCDFAVCTDDPQAGRDHDMEYLYGLGGGRGQEGVAGQDQESGGHNPGEHDHGQRHGGRSEHDDGHDHAHRGLRDIEAILLGSDMTERAKQTALRIFAILAQAEAEAHGVPIDKVHFHEVGAVDSIVDIASVAICLDDLGIDEVIVPVLWEGCGTVRCQHGIIPVPAPATLNIVREYGLNLHQTDAMGEFVTPTGAAIAAAICTGDRLPERYRVERIGMGGGKREHERPGILRAMLITPLPQ